MHDYRAKLDESGGVLIPANCMKMLHLAPGEDLILRVEKNGLYLISLKQSIKQAQDMVKAYAENQSLTLRLRELRKL